MSRMTPPEHDLDAIPAKLAALCAAIELLAVDVDGVLTDGGIVIDDHGVESKRFYVRDGLGFALWRRAGKRSAIVSGRSAEVVARRAAELKIDRVAQGIDDKASAVRALREEFGLDASQICYVGDDLIDLPALGTVGLAACPADAVAEVRRASHLITRAAGGRGVVREVVEVVMKAQGLWHAACEGYRVPAM